MSFLTNRNLRQFVLRELRQNPVALLSEFVPLLRRPTFHIQSVGLADLLSSLNLEIEQLSETNCTLRKRPYLNRFNWPGFALPVKFLIDERFPTLSLSECAQMSELAVKMYWQQYISEQSHSFELKDFQFESIAPKRMAKCDFAEVRYNPSDSEKAQFLESLNQSQSEWPLDLPFFDEKGGLIGTSKLTILVKAKFDALLA